MTYTLPKFNPVAPTYSDGTAVLVDTKRQTVHRFFNDRFLAEFLVASPGNARNMNLVDIEYWKQIYYNKSKGPIRDARKIVLQREKDILKAMKDLKAWKVMDLRVRLVLETFLSMAAIIRKEEDFEMASRVAGSLGRNLIYDLVEIPTGYWTPESIMAKTEKGTTPTSDHLTPRTLAAQQIMQLLVNADDMESKISEVVFLIFKFSHVANVTGKQNMQLKTSIPFHS